MLSLKRTTALIIAVLLLMTNHLALANDRYGKQKVVYHINYDDPKAQKNALGNIQNHLNAVGKNNVTIKVVVHGKGLSLIAFPEAAEETKLTEGNATDNFQAKITYLKSQGVQFLVCSNTLKGKKVDFQEHLYDVSKEDIVPSGVAEIAHLQGQGYAYNKP